MDKIEIIGDKIYLSGYLVAYIFGDAPPSVVERFRSLVEACDVDPETIGLFQDWLGESGYS